MAITLTGYGLAGAAVGVWNVGLSTYFGRPINPVKATFIIAASKAMVEAAGIGAPQLTPQAASFIAGAGVTLFLAKRNLRWLHY